MRRGSSAGEIALTGFAAFPGVPDNPSARLLAAMREAPGLLPENTRFRLVEVGYAAVPVVLDELLAEPPRALVMTGYSARATGLRLEQRAHDWCSADRADAFGFVPATAVREPVWREQGRIDLAALAERVREAGIDCHVSADGGAYVCNHLYHEVLGRIEAAGADTRAVFVHVPAIAGTPLAASSAGAMALAEMVWGVALIAQGIAAR